MLKYIERLKRMDDLIQKKCTGTSEEFARKLGISRSMLMENLKEMREIGAPLSYCPRRRSYVYLHDFPLVIGEGNQHIRGGNVIGLSWNPYWRTAYTAACTDVSRSFSGGAHGRFTIQTAEKQIVTA
jgi:hypothetical protein